MVEDKTLLVAYCGLYCGNCGSYKKGRCKGCQDGGGFASCTLKKCCVESNFRTCAQCEEFIECRKLNNFMARIFSFLFRTDRMGNLKAINNLSIEKWVEEVSVSGRK